MVLHMAGGILSAAWVASLIPKNSSWPVLSKDKTAEPDTLVMVCSQSRKEGDFPFPS